MEILEHFLKSSSSVFLLAVLLLLAYFVCSTSFSHQGGGREPPGPRALPLLGNLLQLDLKRPYSTLLKLSKKYGSVFTVYFGPRKVVVLSGYETVKEALVNYADVFGEKDPPVIAQEFSQGHGVVWSNGDSWKEMRRFAMTNLRDFGMGKKACEDKIIEECNVLIDVFKTFKGEAFDTTRSVSYAVSNIICSIVYGSRFEYSDPQFTSMLNQMNQRLQFMGSRSIQMYNLFPWIGRWVGNRREIQKIIGFLRKQNLELFRRLKETLNPQMCRGFVDAFLVQQQHLEDSGNTDNHFHSENLMITVLNLFAAGTETTTTTLRWGLLFMAKYPKIQDQVQEELRRVIGSRQVQVEDRKNLPFTDAVIHEIQRVGNVLPSVSHRTSQDITFQGYFIKKAAAYSASRVQSLVLGHFDMWPGFRETGSQTINLLMLQNLCMFSNVNNVVTHQQGTSIHLLFASVLFDETQWEKPHAFYPAHFLDKDGKFVKRDAFMPFSAGRRICLGESLARMELFIFFTSLLQHFRFTPPPGISEDELDLTPCVSFTLSPSPHRLCAVSLM